MKRPVEVLKEKMSVKKAAFVLQEPMCTMIPAFKLSHVLAVSEGRSSNLGNQYLTIATHGMYFLKRKEDIQIPAYENCKISYFKFLIWKFDGHK